jgi:apolipoprotein N-acyltransferase
MREAFSGGNWLARTARHIRSQTGWRRDAIATLAGAGSVLAMAPIFATPVLFVTLPALVWLIDGAVSRASRVGEPHPAATSWRQHRATAAGLVGWWFGFGYFLAGLFWIGEAFLVEAEKFAWALPIAVAGMPAGLALFFAGATASAAVLWRPGLSRILVLALTLSATEWLRGHVLTGFPWNVLGYALTWPLPLMQWAGVLGIYGLTLAAVVVFPAPLVLMADAETGSRRSWSPALLVAAALAFAWAYGALVLAAPAAPLVEGVRLRLVQPSVPQREKWRPENQGRIFADHLALSREAPDGRADGLAGITHVIWPEAAMPFLPLASPEALNAIGELLPDGVHLLSGAVRIEPPATSTGRRRGYNSLMVFDTNGRLTALYDKIHLVPFGEYLPLQERLESMGIEQLTRWRGGFTAGPRPRQLLAVPGLPPVLPLICYEAIFPGELIEGAIRPAALINLTNDGWFGSTSGPYQHLHQARVRAVEEALPLIRVANNGVSAVIDPYGRVLASLGLDVRGTIDTGLPAALPPPLYARYGDSTFLLFWLAVLAIWWGLSRPEQASGR